MIPASQYRPRSRSPHSAQSPLPHQAAKPHSIVLMTEILKSRLSALFIVALLFDITYPAQTDPDTYRFPYDRRRPSSENCIHPAARLLHSRVSSCSPHTEVLRFPIYFSHRSCSRAIFRPSNKLLSAPIPKKLASHFAQSSCLYSIISPLK